VADGVAEEPKLLALARHLTAAGYLLDAVLDAITRIPTSYIIGAGRYHEGILKRLHNWEEEQQNTWEEQQQSSSRRQEVPPMGDEEVENEDEEIGTIWSRFWPRKPSRRSGREQKQQKQKQRQRTEEDSDGSKTLASLLALTTKLSELRLTGLKKQEEVVLNALAGVLHVNGMWKDLARGLENLMADGGDKGGWWSCDDDDLDEPGHKYSHGHDAQTGRKEEEEEEEEEEEKPRLICNSRRRMPPRNIMALVMGDLHGKVEAMSDATFDWWLKVSEATGIHIWKGVSDWYKARDDKMKEEGWKWNS
jgi:hypothetical protein